MDSKIVNKVIKQNIWSLLKEHGFSNFTSRSAWRYCSDRIEIINFQSFNSFLAEVVGCTTYSFAVNLGIYYTNIPDQYPNSAIKKKDGYLLPKECRCHLRKVLHKSLSQSELARNDIWYINHTGDNLELAMNDAKQMLNTDGLKWFEKYSNMEMVLETILNEEETNGTHGFGRKNSPIRNYIGGYIALALEKYDIADALLEKAINSECFKTVEDKLSRDYESNKLKKVQGLSTDLEANS